MPTKQSVMDNAPANWRIISNDGTTIVAVNIVTGEVFSGTHAAFNFKTQMAYNSVSTPSDLARHNDMHLGLGTPRTLWASGTLFWLPPGDGGANGMLFAGNGTGAFTLSAAVPASWNPTVVWVYLTANAGGSGNPAGWHYATMSDDTHGIVYADRYDSTSGRPPEIPVSPTTLNCVSATRLTTTTVEIQAFETPFNAATQMGKNGEIRAIFLTGGNTTASAKALSLRAGTSAIYSLGQTSLPLGDWLISIANQGSLVGQTCTRHSTSVGIIGGAAVAGTGLLKTIDLSSKTTLNVTGKLTAVTDSFWFACKNLQITYGE